MSKNSVVETYLLPNKVIIHIVLSDFEYAVVTKTEADKT
jgi:O-acetyl-ADP-ribose deacetylase (regulator of RNase III)